MTIINKEDYLSPPDYLKCEDIGVMATHPYSIYSHASRQAMSLSQMGQFVPLCNAERPMIYHAITDLPSLAITTTVPYDSVIIAIVNRIVVFKSIDETKVFHLELPRWVGSHGRFGFKPIVTEDLYVGQIFKEGDILTKPPTIDGNHFKTGTHLNTLIATYPGNAEDGCILRESAREKLAYDTMTEVTFSIKEGEILTNKWGNEHITKGLPEVGQVIGPDNILCIIRDISGGSKPALMSPKALMRTQIGDTAIQANSICGCVVDSVSVISNISNTSYTYSNACEQLDKYVESALTEQQMVCDAVNKVILDNKRKGLETVEEPDTARYLINARMLLESRKPVGRVKLSYKTEAAPPYMIKIMLLRKGYKPQRGDKLTDRSSAKCTITSIWPDELMPGDADIIVGPDSSINRTIPSRELEHTTNGGAVIAGNLIRNILGYHRYTFKYVINKEDLMEAPPHYDPNFAIGRETVIKHIMENPSLKDECLTICKKWSEVTNPAIWEVLSGMVNEARPIAEYIADIVYHNYVTQLPTSFLAKNPAHGICSKINNSIFEPKKRILTGKNFDGSDIDFKYPMLVAPIYFSLLDKVASDISASPGHMLQCMGLPSTRDLEDKFNAPISKHPPRSYGTDETQISAAALGGAYPVNMGFLEIFDRMTSKNTQEAEVETMLNTDTPSGLITLVDRKKVPYGLSRPLEILNHMLNVHGIEFVSK